MPVFDLVRLPSTKTLEVGLAEMVPKVKGKSGGKEKSMPIRGGRK